MRGNNPFSAGGYIRELVNEHGEISFDDIWAAFLKRGWDPTARAKIYASVQQEATKGTIERGMGKQMFCSVGKGIEKPVREGLKPVEKMNTVNKRVKQSISRQREASRESIFAYITDQLGPASDRPTNHLPYYFLVVGDKTGEQMIDLYIAKYQKDPTHWCIYESENDEVKYYHIGLWSE